MKGLLALLNMLGMFFMILNMFGGIIAGVWLAVLGEWWALGLGLLVVIISSFVLSLAVLPSIALAAGAVLAGKRSKFAFLLLGLLSNLYVVAIMTTWCVGALFAFMSRATEQSWIPLLIWSYGAATGPWSYMASKESESGGGDSSVMAAFFAQVAYLAMVLVGIFVGGSVVTLAKVFAGVMLIGVAMQLIFAYLATDELQMEHL